MALLMTACATTTITTAWKDRSYQGRPHKILVIGVAKGAVNNPGKKRMFEDEFVRQLKSRGTEAIASYTVLPDEKQNDQEAVAAKMKELSADAVLITRLTDDKTVTTYAPEAVSDPPLYYDTWPEDYRHGDQAVYASGYPARDEYALAETTLYDAGNDKLIWTAVPETKILGSDQSRMESYIGIMVNALVDQQLLR